MNSDKILLAFFVFGLIVAPLATDAQQQPARVPMIGWISYGSPPLGSSLYLEGVVVKALRELGYVEGKNIAFDVRYAEGQSERIPELATDLVRLKVDAIITMGGDIAKVVRRATGTIPIVMGSSEDPVRAGLVASLARPGGNVTGVTWLMDELAGKRLELLKEAVPRLSRVAVLWNPAHLDDELGEMRRASRALGMELQSLELLRPADLDGALQAVSRGRAEALVIVPSRLTNFLRGRLAEFAAKSRLPMVSGWKEFAEAGALMTYGPDRFLGSQRVAAYVDKILKGTKPGDLPVEQPTRFELVVNLKTAKALGLTIPQSVLARADQVIQ